MLVGNAGAGMVVGEEMISSPAAELEVMSLIGTLAFTQNSMVLP